MLALRGVPDVRLRWLRRLSHAALIAQGAESWTGSVGSYRVHRYAFCGRGKGPAVLLVWLYVMGNVIVYGAEVNWWRANAPAAERRGRLARLVDRLFPLTP